MSEQTSRDEAVRVGAEAINDNKLIHVITPYSYVAAAVLDAAHKAGLISYQDEWKQKGWLIRGLDESLTEDEWLTLIEPADSFDAEPVFVRRVSFEAGEEVNEEQA